MEALILAGGVYNITLVIFHLLFWRIFNWNNDLRKLSDVNRGIMKVLNLCLTFVFIIFAYISLAHSYELLYSRLGHSMLWFMAFFWIFRSIYQLVFFKLNWISILFLLYFLLGSAIYLIPVLEVT